MIRGGTIVDGTGKPPFDADLVIHQGRIAAIGRAPSTSSAKLELDVSGLIVAPGFIDIHTHSDLSLWQHGIGESKILQGVTTEVVGNCGFSPYPLTSGYRHMAEELLTSIGSGFEDADWLDLEGYVTALEGNGLGINVVSLVGHGALRVAVMGLHSRPPTDVELSRMQYLLDKAMDQGAFGLSTGLTYVPSRYAEKGEIHELVKTASAKDGLYATHSRGLAEHWTNAVQEAVHVGRETNARVQFSHLAINDPNRWGQAYDVLEIFDRAVEAGVDIAFDVYPYEASASSLTQYLPSWVTSGGNRKMRARLTSRSARAKARSDVAAGWGGGIPWLWDRVLILSVPDIEDWMVGQTIESAAAKVGDPPEELILQLCLEHGNAVQVVLLYRDLEDVQRFITHPLSVIGSDGFARPLSGRGFPHPRSFGTFPRVLRRYVGNSDLTLAEAVQKMTADPAARLGLADRGRIVRGAVADMVVFDAAAVEDKASFSNPRQPPVGIRHVLIEGVAVVSEGTVTGARPGKVLRRNG